MQCFSSKEPIVQSATLCFVKCIEFDREVDLGDPAKIQKDLELVHIHPSWGAGNGFS